MEKRFVEEIREAIRRWHDRPAEEWFADMVRRGTFNEKGEVLIRLPEPPEEVPSSELGVSRNGLVHSSTNGVTTEYVPEETANRPDSHTR